MKAVFAKCYKMEGGGLYTSYYEPFMALKTQKQKMWDILHEMLMENNSNLSRSLALYLKAVMSGAVSEVGSSSTSASSSSSGSKNFLTCQFCKGY